MKSKITIDLDYQNNPIIKIEHVDSEDVRDKLVGRFLDEFRYDSCWASFKFDGGAEITNRAIPDSRMAVLIPIHPKNMGEHAPLIKDAHESYMSMRNSDGSLKPYENLPGTLITPVTPL